MNECCWSYDGLEEVSWWWKQSINTCAAWWVWWRWEWCSVLVRRSCFTILMPSNMVMALRNIISLTKIWFSTVMMVRSCMVGLCRRAYMPIRNWPKEPWCIFMAMRKTSAATMLWWVGCLTKVTMCSLLITVGLAARKDKLVLLASWTMPMQLWIMFGSCLG